MKKLILVLFVFILSSAAALAQTPCLDAITATSTEEFLNEIPSLDARLGECDSTIVSPADKFFNDAVVSVEIAMQDGSTEYLAIVTQNGEIASVERSRASSMDYYVNIGECELDTMLRSDNIMGVASYLFNEGKLNIDAVGFWNKIKFFVAKIGIKTFLSRFEVETPIACAGAAGGAAGLKGVGETCDHGGECETGNCIYDRGVGAERIYRCSCDPFELVITPGCPGAQEFPESGLGQPGDICQHGGQCETGNCIYVSGAGADRIYRCSCDPFEYTTAGC